MPDVEQERKHLALADQHISEGERRVTEQMILIEQMRRQGRDTALAEEFLQTLEQTLQHWHAHRQLILDRIARG